KNRYEMVSTHSLVRYSRLNHHGLAIASPLLCGLDLRRETHREVIPRIIWNEELGQELEPPLRCVLEVLVRKVDSKVMQRSCYCSHCVIRIRHRPTSSRGQSNTCC